MLANGLILEIDKSLIWLPLTLVVFVAVVGVGFIPSQIELQNQSSWYWIACAILSIPGILFGIALPRIKVAFMASIWKMPKHAFLLSRPLLRLIGSTIIGGSVATIFLAVVQGGMYWPLMTLQILITAAYCYSAKRRLGRHPHAEFAMPPPLPYSLVNPSRSQKVGR